MKDGLRSYCKPCDKARNAAYTGNPEARAATIARGTKVCSICNQEQPLEQFSANRRKADGYRNYCRACQQSAQQARLYGITQAQKEEMLEAQGKVCAICGADSPGKTRWHTDHCHDSLKVRGILCVRCNTALGLAKDDPTLLRTMAAYIEMHALT